MGIRWFKFKRRVESIVDFFKNLFFKVNCFFSNIFSENKFICFVSNTKNNVSKKPKDNKNNWSDRLVFGEGFQINKEDI